MTKYLKNIKLGKLNLDKLQITKIRKIMKYYASIAEQKIEGGDCYILLDRSQTRQYFDIHKKWLFEIEESLSKQKGKKFHIDICGRTTACRMGFDASYCFALKTSDFVKKISINNHFFIDGDIFNPTEFNKFILFIKENKLYPSLVTFEPVAGLHEYGLSSAISTKVPGYREFVYSYMGKRLEQVIEILRPGGYIYLEKPFQFDPVLVGEFITGTPKNQFDLSIGIKKITRNKKCRIEISNDMNGPYFLIHKPL